ncbi:MAG TPA: chemotaxis protein CheB [Fimbriimonas sp.]|nr:chemotaxis protein CheB [Fimbriimonas sp.]
MKARRLVAIAASAGGIEALSEILKHFVPPHDTAVCVLIHIPPNRESRLPSLLRRVTSAAVLTAEEGVLIESGSVYVAPPNRHLEVTPAGSVHLSSAPRRHFTRPSAEHLFSTAAQAFGDRALLVVLTGTGRNGSESLPACKAAGATVIVQDPKTARYRFMPEAALATGCADFVLDLDQIPKKLWELCNHSHNGKQLV